MATELAKAYVQIIPSAKGIKGAISEALGGEAGEAGDSSGGILGTKLIAKVKKLIAAAGIGKALGAALNEGAALEQSLGGVETLFKENANKVIANAQQAYKSAGVSANEYMETVTSFSASLLQSLSGDTNRAAEVADMALVDMSDNANKMGTSMEDIQNAYQGFAKQNYTMLDNLKLGYGGTKKEMERLLKDAQEISGVEYNIDNLSDVYSAIHVIQGELGITGTTAKEAATTFSGSFSAMKAAVKTFVGNLAIGEDVSASLAAVGDTVYTFVVGNFIPMVGNLILGLGEVLITTDWVAVAEGMITKLRSDIETTAKATLGTDGSIVDALINSINTRLPVILEEGVEMLNSLVSGVLSNLPTLISSAGTVVSEFLNCIYGNLPNILQSGVTLILNLVSGIINSLPEIIGSAAHVIASLLNTILSNAPQMWESGITLIGELAAGLIRAIPNLVSRIPEIIGSIKKEFASFDWGAIGKNIIDGIGKGISNAVGSIVEAAKEAAGSALEAAKKLLGIHSPSKVFEQEVGEMVPLGMAKGIENKSGVVSGTLEDVNSDLMRVAQLDLSYATDSVTSRDGIREIGEYIVEAVMRQGEVQANAIKEGMTNIRMVPNEREFIRFVNGLA